MGNIYSRIMNVSSLLISKLPVFRMWESQSPIFLVTYHRRWKSHIPTSIPKVTSADSSFLLSPQSMSSKSESQPWRVEWRPSQLVLDRQLSSCTSTPEILCNDQVANSYVRAIAALAHAGDNIVSTTNLYGGTYNQLKGEEAQSYCRLYCR